MLLFWRTARLVHTAGQGRAVHTPTHALRYQTQELTWAGQHSEMLWFAMHSKLEASLASGELLEVPAFLESLGL